MSKNADPYKIQVLAEKDCPTEGTCFIAGRVAARPGRVQIVVDVLDDPHALAAYAHKIGHREQLVEIDEADYERMKRS